MSRDIALISKEGERERTDIERFLAREQAERDREIALAAKTRELEIAETKRLASTAEREKAEHGAESVRVVADAERARQVEVIEAGKAADARRIDEESKAQVMRMHMVTQSEARKLAAELEAEATLTRARATTEAQKIGAEGIEREAGARGRAEMEVETLRIANAQRQLEAEATGIEAKAEALKKYNEAATFLELARLRIEAERDVHIDQAKAMGNALVGRANPHVWQRRRHDGYDPRAVHAGLRDWRSPRRPGAIAPGGASSAPERQRDFGPARPAVQWQLVEADL